jgi:hypothetical protein
MDRARKATMDDLTAFISARLSEDEAMAKAAARKRRGPWRVVGDAFRAVIHGSRATLSVADTPGMAIAEHIARHDPARVLREVAARRRTMARHERKPDKQQPWCGWCTDDRHFEAWPCDDIRDLAATWSDHPDYRAGWSPGDAS